MIFSGALYIGRNNSKAIDSVLAHTFLELNRQVMEAEKNALSGPLMGLDSRPLTLDGEEIEAQEALRDWDIYSRRLKEESSQAAGTRKGRQGSFESLDVGGWLRPRNNSSNPESHVERVRPTGLGRRISMALGHVPEVAKGTLTDDELKEIFELNNKVRHVLPYCPYFLLILSLCSPN